MTTLNKPRVESLLTQVSTQYVPTGYISEKILPTINVVQTAGKIGGYSMPKTGPDTGHYLHSGSGEYTRVTLTPNTLADYSLEKNALSMVISEETFANTQDPFDARKDVIEELTELIWADKEKALATYLNNSANYSVSNTSALSGTDQYNDLANSKPLENSIVAREAIRSKTGMTPNIAIMSGQVYDALRSNQQLREAFGARYSLNGLLNADALAAALDVEEVLVGQAMADFAVEGQPADIQSIWGKGLIYAVAPRAAGRRQVTLGYRIQKGAPRRIATVQLEDPIGSEKILMDDWYQQKIINIDAAYLFSDAIA